MPGHRDAGEQGIPSIPCMVTGTVRENEKVRQTGMDGTVHKGCMLGTGDASV
jgi:hypothetical protein